VKAGEMLLMMKDFFFDYMHYRKEIRKHGAWIKKYAWQKGYQINPHWMFYTNLKIWIVESERTFGKRYCPCFEPGADPDITRRLLCPCSFATEEIAKHGTCHCVLFGRKDLTDNQFKEAEARLMEEYRGRPLKLTRGLLDTRGMPKDSLRGLPVPDSLHQVKRSLAMLKGQQLTVLVETRTEADNLRSFAALKGIGFQCEEERDVFRVILTP